MTYQEYKQMSQEQRDAVCAEHLRVRSWDDLADEFGVNEHGDITSYGPNEKLSYISRNYAVHCGKDVYFDRGKFAAAVDGDVEFYRWECEPLDAVKAPEFSASGEDPLLLFEEALS